LHGDNADFNIVFMETVHDCSLKEKRHKVQCSQC